MTVLSSVLGLYAGHQTLTKFLLWKQVTGLHMDWLAREYMDGTHTCILRVIYFNKNSKEIWQNLQNANMNRIPSRLVAIVLVSLGSSFSGVKSSYAVYFLFIRYCTHTNIWYVQ